MKLLKLLKKYFIARKENEYRPHFFREASVLFFSFVIVFFFALSLTQTLVITRTDLLSAILPGVLVDLANGDRKTSGLAPLRVNPFLVRAAQAKANDMAEHGYFSHTGPDGSTPWRWIQEAGYFFVYAGENLAVNFSDSSDVDEAWMNSPAHRANILNQYFTEIGIAAAKGKYQERETTFVVQMFGTPAALPAASSESVSAVPKSLIAGATGPKPTATASQEPPQTEQFKTIVLNDTFVAVKNLKATPGKSYSTPEPAAASPQSSWLAKSATSPRKVLMAVYIFLEIIIIGALIAAVSKEIKRQHPLHFLYGLLLLALISGIVYGASSVVFSQVLVI